MMKKRKIMIAATVAAVVAEVEAVVVTTRAMEVVGARVDATVVLVAAVEA